MNSYARHYLNAQKQDLLDRLSGRRQLRELAYSMSAAGIYDRVMKEAAECDYYSPSTYSDNQKDPILKKKPTNQRRDDDFKKWLEEEKPDLSSMSKAEIKRKLEERDIKLWSFGFLCWWKKQTFHKCFPGRKRALKKP